MDMLRRERERFSAESGSLSYPSTVVDKSDDNGFWDAESDEPPRFACIRRLRILVYRNNSKI